MDFTHEHEWHALDASEVAVLLETDATAGLNAEEAETRLRQVGPNVVTGRRGPGPLRRFLSQFANPLIYVLLVAGTVTALLKHPVDATVIFGVVVLNAIIGYLQESRAHAAIAALSRLITVEATVVRDGQAREMSAAGLVPGDLVLLQAGSRVPADLRLLRVKDLHLNESMLTGESLPVAKEEAPVAADAVLGDRKSMAYSGTLVTAGQASGLVVTTGNQTELGRISRLLDTATEVATPLTRRLTRFSGMLSYVIVGLALATFLMGVLRPGQDWTEVFIAAVALAVAAIPEGLPAVVTIILAVGVTRMAQRNAIIRRLPAVETLGSTTVICSDKTGTLTRNEMTVERVLTAQAVFSL